MSRRYPNLREKVLKRDSKISLKIIKAWDVEKNEQKVLDIFLKEKEGLSPERYWETLRSVWVICGSIKTAPIFRKLMLSNKRSAHYFSTPEEAKKLRELVEPITVYRATNDMEDGGISWTLSHEYARQYKELFNKSMIITKNVYKTSIFALIERNLEEEIIIL